MSLRKTIGVLVGVVLLGAAWAGGPLAPAQDKDAKKEKKSGTVTGVLTAKGPAYIEVKADGEEKARRYVPHWRGGKPNEGGGPDKNVLKTFEALKVGSRVRLEWEFDERPRVLRVEMLQRPSAKEGEQKGAKEEEAKGGTVVGTLAAKEPNYIEIKADGEERARRYLYHRGGTPELRRLIADTTVGSRVRVEWRFLEHLRVMNMEVLKRAEKGS
jgi:hypothetical protein